MAIPKFVCWEIWLSWNKVIFHQMNLSPYKGSLFGMQFGSENYSESRFKRDIMARYGSCGDNLDKKHS
jgi:hypothetical protein